MSDAPKSALELALERLKKKDEEAGIEQKTLTDEQRAAIAEARSLCEARIAERRIMHQSQTASIFDPQELEMKREDLAEMQAWRPVGLETEVFAFGRLPLAFSARCFTARHCNLPKDDCRFSCLQHPDGLLLATREGESFLVLNGTQTQSAQVYTLLQEMPRLAALGVDVLRLSPQSRFMEQIIGLFDDARRQVLPAYEAQALLRELLPGQDCNGYWHGRPGLERVEEAVA